MFCLLALSGHVVKPTALGAVASSPQSLSCLVSEMKVAISASTGSKPRFHGKRLAGRLERRKRSVSSFLPWTLSFPPLSVKSIPTPASRSPYQPQVCPTPGSWWPLSRPVPNECVCSSLVTLVMYGLGQVGVKLAACPIPFQMRRTGKTDFIYFHT